MNWNVNIMLIVFFFKQKTAYEMRISDWSSDVCSSDLPVRAIIARDVDMAGPRIAVVAAHLLHDLRRRVEAVTVGDVLRGPGDIVRQRIEARSEEHKSELQSLMRISYAVFCLKKKTSYNNQTHHNTTRQYNS